MKALTVRQPWAELIASGTKLVENRTAGTNHRGPLAIHVARTIDDAALLDPTVRQALGLPTSPNLRDDDVNRYLTVHAALSAALGHVIAVVDLVDVHEADGVCCGPWARHAYDGPRSVRYHRHLVLARPRRLTVPFPAVGHLGLFDVDNAQIEAAR